MVLPFPERADFFRVLWLRLTSRSSLLLLAKRFVCETYPDKNMLFQPYACSIYPHVFRMTIGLWLLLQPHPTCRPCMRFLSVRPDFCRRLPSDSTSQWTPLPLAICFPSLGRIRDFHPLEHAHAGRTTNPEPPHGDPGRVVPDITEPYFVIHFTNNANSRFTCYETALSVSVQICRYCRNPCKLCGTTLLPL